LHVLFSVPNFTPFDSTKVGGLKTGISFVSFPQRGNDGKKQLLPCRSGNRSFIITAGCAGSPLGVGES
jgi:hypothetical protein